VSIEGEVLLEKFDGEFISLSRWHDGGLHAVLKYRANEFAFQSGPVFGALRVFDPSTRDFYIVKYLAEGHDAVINADYSWSVDRYAQSAGAWSLEKADIPFSKSLKAKLKGIDPEFPKKLESAEKGNFDFDEEFGWSQVAPAH
jgi:hypothetical protein